MAMLISGSVITYGSYRLLSMLRSRTDTIPYEQYMQQEDVEATLVTLKRFLQAKKNKSRNDPYKELRQQFNHVQQLYTELKELIQWRKEKVYRYLYWSGENKKFLNFKNEWAILMSRLQLIKALLYLDKNVL